MKRTASLIILLLLIATSASAMILAGVVSSYRAPQAPNAPTGVTATAGNTQNVVNWIASVVDGSHDAATSYTLYGGTTASPTTSVYSGSATSYTHTGLTNDTPYYYRLTASNTGGASGYTTPDATATPSALAFNDLLTSTTFPSSELATLFLGTATMGSATDGVQATTSGININTVSSTDRAVVMMATPIDLTQSHTYRFRVKVASGVAWVGLFNFGTTPALQSTWSGSGSSVPTLISTYNIGSATKFAAHLSNDTIDQTYGAHTPALNTEYDYTFVVDATNITFTVRRVSDSNVMASHAYAKSSLYPYPAGAVYFAAGKYDDYGTAASSTVTQAQRY